MKYTFPPGFDLARALELAKLVSSAYAQLEQGAHWQPPAGYTLRQPMLSAKEFWKVPSPFSDLLGHLIQPVPFGFVATHGNDVYVVIRGTKTPLEWLDDAAALPVAFQPNGAAWGVVTHGFNQLFKDLGPQILQALQGATGGPGSIFVTGHSLGGALAHLAAAAIKAKFGINPISYTFCGPRTGDPAFAAAHQAAHLQTWRIFNTEDIVPTLPAAAIKMAEANMGMHGLTPLTDALQKAVRLFPIGYQHIGYPVAITFHRDLIADNHDLNNVATELNAP